MQGSLQWNNKYIISELLMSRFLTNYLSVGCAATRSDAMNCAQFISVQRGMQRKWQRCREGRTDRVGDRGMGRLKGEGVVGMEKGSWSILDTMKVISTLLGGAKVWIGNMDHRQNRGREMERRADWGVIYIIWRPYQLY